MIERHEKLEAILKHLEIDITTEYTTQQIALSTSFFNKLKIPTIEEYIDRKLKDQKFTYNEWLEVAREVKSKYSSVQSFLKRKVDRFVKKSVFNEKQKLLSSMTRLDKLYMKVFIARYTPTNRNFYNPSPSEPTLDNYLAFYADAKTGFTYDKILSTISHIFNSKMSEDEDRETSDISMVTLLRLISMVSEEANENIIETTYKLQYSPRLLKLILKSNKELQSFKNDPKRLIRLVQFDSRHYSYDAPGMKLKPQQAKEFAEFYLETPDKRLNTNRIIEELSIHLRNSDNDDLIADLFIGSHRKFSSVIAGSITMDSYSSDTLRFIRNVLTSEGYEQFIELIENDESSKFSNAIQVH